MSSSRLEQDSTELALAVQLGDVSAMPTNLNREIDGTRGGGGGGGGGGHTTLFEDEKATLAVASSGHHSRRMDASSLVTYSELLRVYEQKCTSLLEAVDIVCEELIAHSKVPEISPHAWGIDNDDDNDDDDDDVGSEEQTAAFFSGDLDVESRLQPSSSRSVNPNDMDGAALSRDVKRCFVEAMERLQSTSVPKKRRGNLPKEATAAFRKWFDDHKDNPYPSDEEKRILAAATGTAVPQITNWFINHRKRVWKPSREADGEGDTLGHTSDRNDSL